MLRHPRVLTQERVVAPDELDRTMARLRVPRADIVAEKPGDATDTFDLACGPFHQYRRTLRLEPHGEATLVTETFTYDIAAPMWWLLFSWPIARTLRRRPERGRTPWWAPPSQLDGRASSVLAILCTLSVIAGYLGTVISQTLTFAADEFGNDKGDQGNALAAIRIGVFVSMTMVAMADRRGRRAFTVWGTFGACAFTVLGAASIDLWTLGASQTIARGLTTAVAILITIIAAEELPAGARAYGLSVVTLTAGLGAGLAVWVLPVADLHERAWRIIYALPVLALVPLAHVRRELPETERFSVASALGAPSVMSRRRLALLAGSALLVLAFRTPASQLQNEFLRDERGYDGLGITLFTLCTSTPIGLGVIIGGRLADRHGRRIIGASALAVGSLAATFAFLSHGMVMWGWQLVAMVIGAATVPALGVYGPELFGTRSRGRANGLVSAAGVAGSVGGLLVASHLSDHVSLGQALAILTAGPIAVAVLVMLAYPETAGLELEQINPGDRSP